MYLHMDALLSTHFERTYTLPFLMPQNTSRFEALIFLGRAYLSIRLLHVNTISSAHVIDRYFKVEMQNLLMMQRSP